MIAAALALALLAPAPEPTLPGAYVQRTMARLQLGLPVRVLFYGQSITVQEWWKDVEADLRKRYPQADLTVENRAIGGFAANLLLPIASIDVPSFNPDLVVMHDYGGEPDYEALVRLIRSTTTAELLLQTDHVTSIPGPQSQDRGGFEWHNSHVGWMRDLGKRLQCGVVDVRGAWFRHLELTGVDPATLLSDGVHLNRAGMDLMGSVVLSHLARDAGQPEGGPADMVSEISPPEWLKRRGGFWKVPFDGRRVDVLGAESGGVRFLIDGRPPSWNPGAYRMTRSTPAPGAWFPALLRTEAEKRPLLEDWTATIRDVSADGRRFRFALTGSLTGPDGDGEGDRPFRSRSGRVVIDPSDWALWYGPGEDKPKLYDGMQVRWSVVPAHTDRLRPRRTAGDILVADGLSNGRHTLEIVASGPWRFRSLRVQRPPLGRR